MLTLSVLHAPVMVTWDQIQVVTQYYWSMALHSLPPYGCSWGHQMPVLTQQTNYCIAYVSQTLV